MTSETKKKAKVAIFHHTVGDSSAIGKILAVLARGLASAGYQVTIFGQADLENTRNIRIVKVPVIKRPLVLLYLSYHLVALVVYFAQKLSKKQAFDIKLTIESNFLLFDISYPHFCHRAYLKREWKTVAPELPLWLRTLRWLNHWFRAQLEPFVLRRARLIVVPSRGLMNEILGEYPFTAHKIVVIPNFIDIEAMRCPADFPRDEWRKKLSFRECDIVAVTTALGSFEHKGIFLLLRLMGDEYLTPVKLLVVGGREHELTIARELVESLAIHDKVQFVGLQRDVRPYLWLSDVFVFPSAKEIFPLAVLEAAAAGLPLIVTPLYGVEEFMRDGEMGFVVDRQPESVKRALMQFVELPIELRKEMGEKAQNAVRRYSKDSFVDQWIKVLEQVRYGSA